MKRIRKTIAHIATMPTDILVYYADEFLQRNGLSLQREIWNQYCFYLSKIQCSIACVLSRNNLLGNLRDIKV